MQKGRILRNYGVECIYMDQFCKACLELSKLKGLSKSKVSNVMLK